MGPRTNLQVLLTWSRIRASLSDVRVCGARWLHGFEHTFNHINESCIFSADLAGKPKKRDGGPTAQRLCTRMHPRALLIPTSHLVFSSHSFETVCSRRLESRDLLCRITAFSRDWNRRWKNVFRDNPKPVEARIYWKTTKCRTSETTSRATRERTNLAWNGAR